VLIIFRGHRRRCPHAAKGRDWRRCSCRISVEGTTPDGVAVRKALKTANWELANEMTRSIETGGPSAALQVTEAVERFLADAKARNLSAASFKKYRVLLQGKRSSERASPTLEEYAENKGYRLLKQLDGDALRDFRQQWKDAPLAGRKKLERLRAFFRFACEVKWVSVNPAPAIRPPLLDESPTTPLDDDEVDNIYSKLPEFVAKRKAAPRGQGAASDHLERLKALLLVLERTGLRFLGTLDLLL
jgi:site-specific recombinase XerD